MIHIVKEQTVQRTVGSLSTCRWSLQIKTGLEKFGGAKRDRTADLLRARQALSQLSYGPTDSDLPLRDDSVNFIQVKAFRGDA